MKNPAFFWKNFQIKIFFIHKNSLQTYHIIERRLCRYILRLINAVRQSSYKKHEERLPASHA